MADDLLVTDAVLEDPLVLRRLLANIIERLNNDVNTVATAAVQQQIDEAATLGGITSYYQDDAPSISTALIIGDLWFDTSDSNTPYRFDGTSWVVVTDGSIAAAQSDATQALVDAAQAQATADGKITTFYTASEPTAEGVGDMWVDTDDDRLYRWSGAIWTEIQDADILQALTDAATAQTTADGKIVTYYNATAPTAEGVGDLWVDTDDDNQLYRWSGSNWISLIQANSLANTNWIGDPYFAEKASGRASLWQSHTQAVYNSSSGENSSAGVTVSANGNINDIYYGTAIVFNVQYNQRIYFRAKVFVSTDFDGEFGLGASGYTIDRVSNSNWPSYTRHHSLVIKGSWIEIQGSALVTATDTEYLRLRLTVRDTATTGFVIFSEVYFSLEQYYPLVDTTIASAAADATQALADAATAQGTADGKVVTYYQTTMPAGSLGDLWLDSDDGNRIYRHNGTTFIAVQDTDIATALSDAAQGIADAAGAQGTADGKVTTFYTTTAPTAEGVGDLWIDTDDGNQLYRWSGSVWVTIRDTTIASAAADATQALADAATAQGTADGKVVTYYQTTMPAGSLGDLWLDSDDGNRIYRHNGTTFIAVQDTDIATALSDAAQGISDAAGAQGTADGKVTTFYTTTAPTAEGAGDLWIDTNDGNQLYRWSGSVWVTIRDTTIADAAADAVQALADAAAASTLADSKIVTFYQTTMPGTGSEGDLWIDTDDGNRLYRHNGSTFVTVQDADIASALSDAAQGISDAAGAQATADNKIVTFYQIAMPTTGEVGDLWVDTNDGNRLYRHNGTTFVTIRDTTIADAALTADWTGLDSYPGDTAVLNSNTTPADIGYTGDLNATENTGALADLNTVDTPRIDDNAVTQISSVHETTLINRTVNTEHNLLSMAFTATGKPIHLSFTSLFYGQILNSSAPYYTIKLKRGSTVLHSLVLYNLQSTAQATYNFEYVDTPSAGSYTYYWTVTGGNFSSTVQFNSDERTGLILEVKK